MSYVEPVGPSDVFDIYVYSIHTTELFGPTSKYAKLPPVFGPHLQSQLQRYEHTHKPEFDRPAFNLFTLTQFEVSISNNAFPVDEKIKT